MNEEICDCRFAICDLTPAACRNARSGHDRGQLAHFLPERVDFGFHEQATIDNQFHPIRGFISFLFHRSKLRDELGFGTSATSRAVSRADRCPASYQLISQRATFGRFWKRGDKLKNPQRELLGSILQFDFVHNRERFAILRSIANRKSKIANS